MPNSRHTTAIFSPSRSRAMNLSRSSIGLHSFQGTFALLAKGRVCNPCLRNELLPISQEGQGSGVGAAGDAEHLDHGAAVVQKLRRLAVIALDIDPVGTVDRLNSRAKRIDLNGRVPGRVNRGKAFSAARRLASRSQPQQADQERAPIAR